MDAKLKQKWIAELRSGKYHQGPGHLERKFPDTGRVENCCLGVLCRVADVPADQSPEGTVYFDVSHSGFPTEARLEEWGLKESLMFHLADLNDAGIPFDQIADVIEEEA